MTAVAYEEGRWEPPIAGDDAATLPGFLERQRATFAWKSGDLDAAGLRATLGPSAMTPGGMLKHLARFEDDLAAEWLHGRAQRPPWHAVDWRDAVARSRALLAAAMAEGDRRDSTAPSLRYILLNMIEEYARHNGTPTASGDRSTGASARILRAERRAAHAGSAPALRQRMPHPPRGSGAPRRPGAPWIVDVSRS